MDERGTQFDPELAGVFIRSLEMRGEFGSSDEERGSER
jgi:hypothetical protein